MWNANTLSRELNVYSANLLYSLEENGATKTLNSSANCFILKSSLSTFNWLFRKSGFNKMDWCWTQYTSLSQYNYVDYFFFFFCTFFCFKSWQLSCRAAHPDPLDAVGCAWRPHTRQSGEGRDGGGWQHCDQSFSKFCTLPLLGIGHGAPTHLLR